MSSPIATGNIVRTALFGTALLFCLGALLSLFSSVRLVESSSAAALRSEMPVIARSINPDSALNPQQRTGGSFGPLLAAGDSTPGPVYLSAYSQDSDIGDTYLLQFEVRFVNDGFASPRNPVIDNETYYQSAPSASNGFETKSVRLDRLQNGYYKWQVRSVDFNGDSSQWRVGGSFIIVDAPKIRTAAVYESAKSVEAHAPVAPDSFLRIDFSGGTYSTGNLVAKSESSGVTCDYIETSVLSSGEDTVVIPIWTKQSTLGMYLGMRTDTTSLNSSALPPGYSNSPFAMNTFNRTILMLEFSDSRGNLLGDTRSTTRIGETFSYAVKYMLSESTVAAFAQLGFDTSPTADSFRLYFADTYGGSWTKDSTCTVAVAAGPRPGMLCITAYGISRDLPGGLGAAESVVISVPAVGVAVYNVPGRCIIEKLSLPSSIVSFLRYMRDRLMESAIGRLMVNYYYTC